MEMTHEYLVRLLDRAEAGDEEAIRALRGIEDDIRMMVRVRLPRPMRSQFDSMDFVQDVWQSFFRKVIDAPDGLSDVRDLRRFLAGMVRNKIHEEYRRRTLTQKYDLGREEPLYVRRGNREVARDVVAPDPTPSQNAQAKERLDQIVAGRTPQEKEVIDLRRQGLTFDEIAERTGLHERTVRRVIDSARKRLESRDRE